MWKTVVGFEGLYAVSDSGEIYSHITQKNLKPAKKRGGDYQVTLSKDGTLTYKTVHTVVAEAFLEKPEGKYQVNHKDGDKSNNRADNLEWCTCQENVIHCIYILGKHKVPIAQYSKDGELIKVWNSIVEAAKSTGTIPQNIWRNANNIRKSANGYVWRYF